MRLTKEEVLTAQAEDRLELAAKMRQSCSDWERSVAIEDLHMDSDYDDQWKGPTFPADTGVDSPFRNPNLVPEA